MAIPGVRPRFLAPGDKLGKFELIRQIAVGGMAEIYLARTMGIEGFEKLVVVKRILPQYSDNKQFVSMFLNEARLSATLHHPNIAQVYDIGVEDGDYFFSMEYIHGENLGHLHATGLENGVPMSLDAALTLAAGLCAGLHYAHTKAGPDGKPLEVVHRDVSPSNVLVSYDGGVKLVDFGIARAGSAPQNTRGGLKGKIAYMSPEQCRGEAKLDRRSDIFSVGTILYELTTGRLPFVEENEYAVLNNIVNVDVPKPSTVVPSYAPPLEAIVLKAMARDPAQRFTSALELQKVLEDFAHDNRLRVSPLVLARLMSTLFPARLEEWDQARAQGAFFVEQHVLRTLVESGRTQAGAEVPIAAVPPVAVVGDDEATELVTALPSPKRLREIAGEDKNPFGPNAGTLPGQGPTLKALPSVRAPTPPPRAPTPPPVRSTPPSGTQRAPTPAPMHTRPPTPTPVSQQIISAAIAPESAYGAPGVLVSNPSMDAAPVATSSAADVTERVRAPLPPNDETAFVRVDRKSRAPLIIGIGVLLAGAGIAAFIAFGGSSDPSSMPSTSAHAAEPAKASEEPTAEPAAKPVAEPVAEPVAKTEEPAPPTEEPAPVAKVDEAKVDEAKVEPVAPIEIDEPAVEAPKPKVEAKRPVRVAKKSPKKIVKKSVEKAVAKKAEPKTEPKTEPKKETEWNADSPFMPVRQ